MRAARSRVFDLFSTPEAWWEGACAEQHIVTMQSPRIINLEEGWTNEIKTKAIDVLEEMLNNGFDKRSTRMFAPKEYVQTYTCVRQQPARRRRRRSPPRVGRARTCE